MLSFTGKVASLPPLYMSLLLAMHTDTHTAVHRHTYSSAQTHIQQCTDTHTVVHRHTYGSAQQKDFQVWLANQVYRISREDPGISILDMIEYRQLHQNHCATCTATNEDSWHWTIHAWLALIYSCMYSTSGPFSKQHLPCCCE